MIIIVYFFLLCLGDYTGFKSDSAPFGLEDITFSCDLIIFTATSTEADLFDATLMMLTFNNQKNGMRGKDIVEKASREPLMCPKDALLWSVFHLRSNKATPSTPIAHAMMPIRKWENTTPKMNSETLKTTVILCGPNLGF